MWNRNNFHSLEVVDRVSETQLQVSENSNWIIWRLKGHTSAGLMLVQHNYSRFNRFYYPVKSLLLGGNELCVHAIEICKCLVSNSTNTSNFHPLEVVDRGSETQLQVGENLG